MKAIVAAVCIAAAALAPHIGVASDDLLVRMAALNPTLHAFSASIHADLTMKTFPYLTPSLDGTYYHKEPSKNKIVFTSGVPAVAKKFSKVYPQIISPSQWNEVYIVTRTADDGMITTFRLVPRKGGRIDHIDARVDDRTATIQYLRWNYVDGGFVDIQESYALVGGNYLVAKQTGHLATEFYKADMVSTFSNFVLNPNLDDGFFTGESS